MRAEGATAREETQRRDLKREKEAPQLKEFEWGRWRRDCDWRSKEERPRNVLGFLMEEEEEESAMAMVLLFVPTPRANNRRMRKVRMMSSDIIRRKERRKNGENNVRKT